MLRRVGPNEGTRIQIRRQEMTVFRVRQPRVEEGRRHSRTRRHENMIPSRAIFQQSEKDKIARKYGESNRFDGLKLPGRRCF